MLELKQGATDKVIPFLLVASADHILGAVGLTPTVAISKNGGAFAAPAGTVTEVGLGWYKLTPGAADTGTTGSLVVHASSAGADPSDRECVVVSIDPYDAAAMGPSNLDAAVTSRSVAGDPMTLDLTQTIPLSNPTETLGDALNAARAMGFGKWTVVGNTMTIYAPDGVTPVRTFTLDDGANPTQRV